MGHMFWLGCWAPACICQFVSLCGCLVCGVCVLCQGVFGDQMSPCREKQGSVVSKRVDVSEEERWKRRTFSTQICLASFRRLCILLVSVVPFLSFISPPHTLPFREAKHTATYRKGSLESWLIVSPSRHCLTFNLNPWPFGELQKARAHRTPSPFWLSHKDRLNVH